MLSFVRCFFFTNSCLLQHTYLVSLLLLLKSLWEASGKRLSRIFAALFALILTCVLMGSNLISAYYKARANTTLEAMNTMVKEYMVEQGYQYEPGMTLTDNSIIFRKKKVVLWHKRKHG